MSVIYYLKAVHEFRENKSLTYAQFTGLIVESKRTLIWRKKIESLLTTMIAKKRCIASRDSPNV